MNIRNRPLVYMAEITYDTNVISNEYFPIAIGYIAGYANKQLPDMFSFKLFNFPNSLLDSIDECPPDILALSYFPWNNNLSLFVADYYLKRKPEGLVVFGGGNLQLEPDRQIEFFKKNTQVDIFVMYDGEFGFLEVLKSYLQNKADKNLMMADNPMGGCIFWNREKEKIVSGKLIPRLKTLDEIPSPYLTGLMDPFFKNQLLTPRIQSTRGCPFTCAYCWAGCDYSSQVRHFSVERTSAELDYIAERRGGNTNRLLIFCDTNFGMYPKDEILAEKIASLQAKYNFPSSFDAPGGKDNRERVVRIIKQIKNASANVSVQSTDNGILRNVKRKPVKLEEYKKIVNKFCEMGVPVVSEIITGLPGETRQTHLQTIKDLIHIGIDEIDAFTLMFLEGTELTSKASQEKNRWDKRYRILPRDFGKYRGKVCFEIETVGVGSNTYNFEDYLYLRGFHGALKVIFNKAFFKEFTSYLKQAGVDIFFFCLSFYEAIKKDKGPAGEEFRSFLAETRNEIWDDKEELIRYFQIEENYQKLLTGDMGENLMIKYKAISVCDNFDAWCDFFFKQSIKAVSNGSENSEKKQELEDIKKHILSKACNILSEQNKQGNPEKIALKYDVLKWQKERYSRPLSEYKFNKPVVAQYKIKRENMRIVEEILSLNMTKSSLWKAVGNRYYLPALFREGHIDE